MSGVAYLIKSHRNTSQVERLARTLVDESPTAEVAIHHDPGGSRLPEVGSWGQGRVHLLTNTVRVNYLSWSTVEAALRLLSWALEKPGIDWVVLLSGQDYPLVPVLEIERFLAHSQVDGHIDGEPLAGNSAWDREVFMRYYFHHRAVLRLSRLSDRSVARLRSASTRVNAAQSLFNVHVGGGSPYIWLGYRALRVPFDRRPCWVGSEWSALSRKAVQSIVRVVRDEPGLVRHYRRTLLPDESFFQTILFDEAGLRLRRDSLHYIRWSGPESPHPEVLGIGDLAAARASGKYLARKFDETANPGVLDALDSLRREDDGGIVVPGIPDRDRSSHRPGLRS
jgi:hypothetical protein